MQTLNKDYTTDLSIQLWELIPDRILSHYSKIQGKGTFDICHEIVINQREWVDRVFTGIWSLNDLMHDVEGIISNDEHFVPRI